MMAEDSEDTMMTPMINANYCQPQPPAEHLGLLQGMMRLSPNLKIRVVLEIRQTQSKDHTYESNVVLILKWR